MPDDDRIIHLSEWGRKRVAHLSDEACEALSDAAQTWKEANHLPHAPLQFAGTDGKTIEARQFVGVVEAGGWTVEIYPKLDAHLLDEDGIADDAGTSSVMRGLLWMLDVSGHEEIVDADAAALEEMPSRFLDLFAYLFARQLRQTLLTHGLARRYETWADDLPGIRGRLRIGEQVTRNGNRLDKLACTWDEFTPATPINRLLRCACRVLAPRVRHAATAWLLTDCVTLMDDVNDVDPATALRDTHPLPEFARGTWERYRRPFLLGRRLLSGLGHQLNVGDSETFVFLLDMNKVFESYARAALEAQFDVRIETQKNLGTLLKLFPGGIQQYADFFWQTQDGRIWIGDAKYKHLAKGRQNPLQFKELASIDEYHEPVRRAGNVLSPDDVRQLTVYAELYRRRSGASPGDSLPNLVLLYPFVGTDSILVAPSATTWNNAVLHIVPLRVHQQERLADALPQIAPACAPQSFAE